MVFYTNAGYLWNKIHSEGYDDDQKVYVSTLTGEPSGIMIPESSFGDKSVTNCGWKPLTSRFGKVFPSITFTVPGWMKNNNLARFRKSMGERMSILPLEMNYSGDNFAHWAILPEEYSGIIAKKLPFDSAYQKNEAMKKYNINGITKNTVMKCMALAVLNTEVDNSSIEVTFDNNVSTNPRNHRSVNKREMKVSELKKELLNSRHIAEGVIEK